MTPFAEKSKMSLILKRQKNPLSRQICPVGYLIISVLLEVKALLQQTANTNANANAKSTAIAISP